MARYIKANPLVARYLQLENERNKVSDGNYLLWQADILKFGPLTQLNSILVQIGAIALMAHEARQEQDGSVVRPLPQATDARFVQPTRGNDAETDEADAATNEASDSTDATATDEASDGTADSAAGTADESSKK